MKRKVRSLGVRQEKVYEFTFDGHDYFELGIWFSGEVRQNVVEKLESKVDEETTKPVVEENQKKNQLNQW